MQAYNPQIEVINRSERRYCWMVNGYCNVKKTRIRDQSTVAKIQHM
jgi:hypothetical protein